MPGSHLSAHCCGNTSELRPLEDLLYDIETWPLAQLATEHVDLGSAITRVIAEPVISPLAVPPYRNSAVDGYGYRCADRPPDGRLPLVGRSAAGHPFREPVPVLPAAIRILTGAAVPSWVDTVAMQEDCVTDNGAVVVHSQEPGAHIRAAGQDVTAGAVVLRRGDRLRPQDVGMAASVGQAWLTVFRKVRVAVFATGDELRPPGDALPEGCIYDSNRFVSAALFRRLGFDVTDLGIVADNAASVRGALADAAAEHDLVVTSGGVSEGDEDHVVPAVRALGTLTSWKLAMKPGKPVAVGQLENCAFVGLPGNPVAAMVALATVARPLALRLAGATQIAPRSFPVVAADPIQRDQGRRQFIRGKLEPHGATLAVRRYRSDSSGILSSLTWSDGLIDVGPGAGGVSAGEAVDFLPYSELFG
jgi:molybdopterin molybdotransferase